LLSKKRPTLLRYIVALEIDTFPSNHAATQSVRS